MPYDIVAVLPDDPAGCKAAVHQALVQGHDRMTRLEAAVAENTRLTKDVIQSAEVIKAQGVESQKDTAEILNIFRASRGTTQVLGWLGKFIIFVAGVWFAVSTLMSIFKGGQQ